MEEIKKIREGQNLYIRNLILENLLKCTDEEQMLFRRMYSHKDLGADLAKIVSEMPIEKIDWAYTQIKNTLAKKL